MVIGRTFVLLLLFFEHPKAAEEQSFPNLAVVRADSTFTQPERPMDLQQRVLRFVPGPQPYQFQVESPEWKWEDVTGEPGTLTLQQPHASISLASWKFPFSGQNWDKLYLNSTGSLTFGQAEDVAALPRYFYYRDIGARKMITGPILAPLWRRYGAGIKYWTSSSEGAVTITMEFEELATEPNRFIDIQRRLVAQIRLESSGAIEFRYQECSFVDGSVLVAPALENFGQPRLLQQRTFAPQSGLDPYLDFREARIEQINSLQLRFTMNVRGPIPAPRPGLLYWLFLDTEPSLGDTPFSWEPWNCSINISRKNDTEWVARNCAGELTVQVEGQTVSVVIPRTALGPNRNVRYAVVTQDNSRPNVFKAAGNFSLDIGDTAAYAIEQNFSAISGSNGGALLAAPMWESFHHLWLNPDTSLITKKYYERYQDTADFLVVFTAFPYDNTEVGGSHSGVTNQIGGLNIPITVTAAARYGSAGRLQSVINPIMLCAPFHARAGTDAFGTWGDHERSMWLITHEVGHRWGMLLDYLDGDGSRKSLWEPGSHWRAELSSPSAFPITGEFDTSPMGGYRWRSNDDGTFTAVYGGYALPAGFSWLDLYAMGLAKSEEVPEIEWIDGLEWIGGRDGFQLARGTLKRISMQQVLSAMGPRTRPGDLDQTDFRTAFILVAGPGGDVPEELLERLDTIRVKWMEQFAKATGGRATMKTDLLIRTPKP